MRTPMRYPYLIVIIMLLVIPMGIAVTGSSCQVNDLNGHCYNNNLWLLDSCGKQVDAKTYNPCSSFPANEVSQCTPLRTCLQQTCKELDSSRQEVLSGLGEYGVCSDVLAIVEPKTETTKETIKNITIQVPAPGVAQGTYVTVKNPACKTFSVEQVKSFGTLGFIDARCDNADKCDFNADYAPLDSLSKEYENLPNPTWLRFVSGCIIGGGVVTTALTVTGTATAAATATVTVAGAVAGPVLATLPPVVLGVGVIGLTSCLGSGIATIVVDPNLGVCIERAPIAQERKGDLPGETKTREWLTSVVANEPSQDMVNITDKYNLTDLQKGALLHLFQNASKDGILSDQEADSIRKLLGGYGFSDADIEAYITAAGKDIKEYAANVSSLAKFIIIGGVIVVLFIIIMLVRG